MSWTWYLMSLRTALPMRLENHQTRRISDPRLKNSTAIRKAQPISRLSNHRQLRPTQPTTMGQHVLTLQPALPWKLKPALHNHQAASRRSPAQQPSLAEPIPSRLAALNTTIITIIIITITTTTAKTRLCHP